MDSYKPKVIYEGYYNPVVEKFKSNGKYENSHLRPMNPVKYNLINELYRLMINESKHITGSSTLPFINDIKYDFLLKNKRLYSKISNFLYAISDIEDDAMIQSIYGGIDSFDDEELMKIIDKNASDKKKIELMINVLDQDDICDLRYKDVLNYFDDIEYVYGHIIEWLIIGNRFKETTFKKKYLKKDKPYVYFSIDYVTDYFNKNVSISVLPQDELNDIIRDIEDIKNIVNKRISHYRHKVESVTRDCLIERGFIEGEVTRNDDITYKDISIKNKRIKNKPANVYDEYDRRALIDYKNSLKNNS